MNNTAVLAGDYGDSLMTVQSFCDRYPNIYPKQSRIRWLLRDRMTNGLLDRGAVVEVFANGNKPALYIHAPNWFRWMQAGGTHAPKSTR
ncbi:hypothetical protein N9251_03185 [Gammaproteobacteria bacterium]|nr:hypothetical protein [Gammaproteobacteria bacterium]